MTDTLGRLAAALKGRYDIQRELGSGGMATVYLARDVRHERDVAIKVLHPDLGAALGSERFLTEIRTTARLQHPHILPLLDSGEADRLLYYVMPFVTGESLRERLDRDEQLPIPAAVAIAREVADALGAAHELGIVHRDIKPENILLRGNHAVVADFGIALAVQHAGGQRMTQTGLSLGTPQYMSPEQAMGERNIGPGSDIYSLGAVTYEMIAGDPPFTGHNVQAIVAKVMSEAPTPLSTVRGTVPPHIEDAVLTALAKLPADRFATAGEFAAALADESRPATLRATTRRSHAPSGIRSRIRDPLVAGLGAGVVLLAALAGVLAMRPSSRGSDPVTRVAVAFPDAQQIVPQWRGFNLALSKDGSRLAYIGAGPTRNTVQVWLRPLDALEATPVPGTVGMTTVRFSPDGRSIIVSPIDDPDNTGTGLVVALDRGERTEFPNAAGGEIGASGRVYSTAADSQSVFIIRQSTGGARDTVKVQYDMKLVTGRGFNRAPLAISVLPDESAVLMSVHGDSAGVFANTEIIAVSLASGQATLIGKGVFAQYLSSGHLLYVSGTGDLFVAPFDARRFRITGKATAVGRVALSSNAGRVWPQVTVSDEGTLVYISGELHRQRLVWLDQQGRVLERLASEGNFWGIDLSPDGSRVALSIRQDDRLKNGHAGGTGDIFVEDTRTGERTRLTSTNLNMRPSWSADGQFVLFSRVGDVTRQSLVERRADASAPERLVLSRQSFGNSVGDGRWFPDHRTLIVRTYATAATGSRDVFHWAVNGADTTTTPVTATRAEEHSPELSPDGRLIAYASNETGMFEVYVQPASGGTGRLRVSNGGGGAARWSRDGRRLYYWDNRNRLMVVSIQSNPSLAVLGVREIGGDVVPSMASPGSNFGFDVAPDGRILVTENVPGTYSVVLVRNWLADIGN